jgi:hypothetical protein
MKSAFKPKARQPTRLPPLPPDGFLAVPDLESEGFIAIIRGRRVDLVACSAWADGFRAWGRARNPEPEPGPC